MKIKRYGWRLIATAANDGDVWNISDAENKYKHLATVTGEAEMEAAIIAEFKKIAQEQELWIGDANKRKVAKFNPETDIIPGWSSCGDSNQNIKVCTSKVEAHNFISNLIS